MAKKYTEEELRQRKNARQREYAKEPITKPIKRIISGLIKVTELILK